MAEPENHVDRLNIAIYTGREGRAGSFPLRSNDRDYIKACFKAFLVEYTRQHGSPDRIRMWVD